MLEIIPQVVDTAFLYFHSRCSSGAELQPFVDALRQALPNTYLWAGDGVIDGESDPVMRNGVNYGKGPHRYWFVFPMHGSGAADFAAATEAMGAVLATSGGYTNAWADQVCARFKIPAARVVLCGHQHGACVALAAAMMRRQDPFALTVLFDPWPLEAYYLQHEAPFPATRVVCVDNLWVRERERQRGAKTELYKVFRQSGINAEGITLTEGENKSDAPMFREAIRLLQAAWR